MEKKKYWVASVSKEHVLKGKEWEIMQVCHGKKAPLQRIKKGDLVVFYSPREKMNDNKPLQTFTAIAQVKDEKVYQVEQFKGFMPFRRKVGFLECRETPIRPLIDSLDFIKNKQHWGYPFRYGLLQISEKDFRSIAHKMTLKHA